MNPSVGNWWPVAAANEVGSKPVGLTRFGERLVFWRAKGQLVCMPDRCPHRGAALSLGAVNKKSGTLACPFHGLEFAANGQCVHVPVEKDARIPEGFGVTPYATHEADGYIWIWRGDDTAPSSPSIALHPDTLDMRYGEATGIWNAHYSRCIENVIDFSHLPFVHKTTIGLFKKNWYSQVDMEDVPGGFRAHLIQDDARNQSLEFLYPNRWLLRLAPRIMLGLVFAPIDATHTFVYGRTWYKAPIPGIKWLMDGYTRFSQFMVFREDWPIVASQIPGNVLEATDEKLFPSDAPVLAYRKMHRAHY
jgi:phenylpropionate dioxygenase-like ring-hydroxylating dioxygenase large terminal subunit